MPRPIRIQLIAPACWLAAALALGALAVAGAQESAAPPAGHAVVTPAEPSAATHERTAAASAEPAAEAHGTEAGEGHGGESGEHGEHAVNLVTLTAKLLQGGRPAPTRAATFLMRFQAQLFAALVSILLITVLSRVAAKRTDHPGRLQAAVEMMFDGLYGLFRSVMGPEARAYTPYLGTLFLFILLNNLMGMVPLMFAATSVLNTTVGLAICTFLYVQGIGIRKNGVLGYLHHMAGSPRNGMEWGFSLLLFPLHVLGEFIKPMSLSLRLYGNIFGEETLVATFIVLGAGMLSWMHVTWVGLPIQVPLMFLGLLTSVIQALVFTLLSTVYIALMLPHHEHAEEHGAPAHAH